MEPEVKHVVDFWFNRPPMEWLIAPKGLDEQIKAQFSDLVLKARDGKLDHWAAEPESSLALVVLLDQFSRNLFRGSPDAFSADGKALDVATRAIAQDFDKKVTVIQASAFYMPFMHQESAVTLTAARCLFEALKARCGSEEEHKWVDMGVPASKAHMQQIQQFGRYPTRNALLGRTNTAAEEDFLREHKSSI
ncbi:DUF924-domain-containing protein [Pseudovirgaria hyperparasitica]|uniref:DUF924-domain-containing protein n=1 Tax=Pseudovirgaria hyperparasitica TaxID=470096 RepID=A0A6A6W2I1_9PEZI|nr:DUF924-domain-containing protein [Pseudovirgaria hyperparasitica]KAF2757138.1 DUF924-domain-containing protein [Pseudovirgaria hyperparasitica]